MLHISKIYNIIERSTPEKGRVPFNCIYIKRDGDVREYKNVICISSHFRPPTINVQLPNGDVKKLRCVGITEINGIEIFI